MMRFSCALFAVLLISSSCTHAEGYTNEPGPRLLVDKWVTAQPNTSGKFVLLEFWATWCPACRQSVAHLNELHRKFADRSVVIGLSDEKEEVLRSWANPRPLYALATDSQARNQHQLGIDSIPHLLVIDPDGTTRWRGDPRHLREGQLEALLNARAGTKPPPTPKAESAPTPQSASLSQPQPQAAPANPKPPDPRLFSPAPKARVAVQLKDGTLVQGEWIGRFANRIAVRLTNGRLMDIKDAEIVKCQELRN